MFPHRADPPKIYEAPAHRTVVSELELHLLHLHHEHHLMHLLHLRNIEIARETRQVTRWSPPAPAANTQDQKEPAQASPPPQISGGTLGCTGLESLWIAAGGPPGVSRLAADIAMAESGGQQYALSPAGDRGYWQINWSNGALSTFDAYGNARAAVIISHDGTDWSPWVTYMTGAYTRSGC